MKEFLSNGVCVCERSSVREREINSRNARIQENGMYRNIASVLNSIKLDELSRLLNKYKNVRKDACERK